MVPESWHGNKRSPLQGRLGGTHGVTGVECVLLCQVNHNGCLSALEVKIPAGKFVLMPVLLQSPLLLQKPSWPRRRPALSPAPFLTRVGCCDHSLVLVCVHLSVPRKTGKKETNAGISRKAFTLPGTEVRDRPRSRCFQLQPQILPVFIVGGGEHLVASVTRVCLVAATLAAAGIAMAGTDDPVSSGNREAEEPALLSASGAGWLCCPGQGQAAGAHGTRCPKHCLPFLVSPHLFPGLRSPSITSISSFSFCLGLKRTTSCCSNT
ncbi:uncharacterized protein LOC102382929 isoform X2 [Alligator sinensis]|nr:uncharacterized protein LOC102382929 isoform X2 [Alligator sinensis]